MSGNHFKKTARPDVQPNPAKKKPTKRTIIIVIVVILLIAAIGGNTNKPKDDTTASSTSSVTSTVSTTSTTSSSALPVDAVESQESNQVAPMEAEESQDATFNPDAYSLQVELIEIPQITPPYRIISVYGNTSDDFAAMGQVLQDAASCYGLDPQQVIDCFNNEIGSEGSSGDFHQIGWSIITSSPNEYETWYRADLYMLM